MTQALQCRGVTKRLGDRRILNALDLEVGEGEVLSLLGASGSGKTTLLRVIAGLIEPDAGEIVIGGRTVWSRSQQVPPEKRRVGMVFQDYALWPHMTVAGNLAFGLAAQHLPQTEIAARLRHALDVAQLAAYADRYPGELSGGQQQRVAIARCLAARPGLMLFDEPLSNLDAALREDLRTDMMRLVRQEGITAVYVTHDQAEAMAVSDRIAVMRAGSIAQLATPQRIYEAPSDVFVANFIGGFSLLPGTAESGSFRIADSDGPALQTANGVAGAVALVVRPEDARPAAAFPVNCLSGEVLSRAFQGRCWRLVIAVGRHRIRLDWPEGPAVGSILSFSLPPERCTLVAR